MREASCKLGVAIHEPGRLRSSEFSDKKFVIGVQSYDLLEDSLHFRLGFLRVGGCTVVDLRLGLGSPPTWQLGRIGVRTGRRRCFCR